MYGLEGRYAHAVYAAAAKNNQLDAVDKDFQSLLVILIVIYLFCYEKIVYFWFILFRLYLNQTKSWVKF